MLRTRLQGQWILLLRMGRLVRQQMVRQVRLHKVKLDRLPRAKQALQ